MTVHTRTIVVVILVGAVLTSLVLAQGAGPAPQGQPPPTPPAEGRGGAPGQGGAPPGGGGQGRGGRAGGFTQFTRPLAPQDVLVRGKGLYEANCASCHSTDLRGGVNGANLLRSGIALADRHGELVGAAVARHDPALTLASADTVAIADNPRRSRHDERAGQSSRAESRRDRTERAGRRCEVRRDLFRARLFEVPFGDGRPQGHRCEISRRPRLAERLDLRFEQRLRRRRAWGRRWRRQSCHRHPG